MSKNLINNIKEKMNLLNVQLGDEYNYPCLPLAVIDAIYSLQIGYKNVNVVVKKYADAHKVDKSHSISDLIKNIEAVGVESFANDILGANYRTAGRNPNLKSEAVYEWAKILKKNGIETFADFRRADKTQVEKELLQVQGQGKTVVKYLFMLCGDEHTCKPDTHILNFLKEVLQRNVKSDEAQALLERIVKELKKNYPTMTVRLLDHLIWNYQRNKT